jgi:hypothetical protein
MWPVACMPDKGPGKGSNAILFWIDHFSVSPVAYAVGTIPLT